MFTNDVKCNDCHDAHSLKLVKTGNDLCLQCHRAEIYDSYDHHFHKKKDHPGLQEGNHRQMYNQEGEGALCINCHMDGGFYMGVDYRRDHSFRIPRPDLTLSLGVPNACNSCHTDKTPEWSEKYISEWYGKKRAAHYGSTIAGGEDRDPAALETLITIATASEDLYPLMVRATALSLLANYSDEKAYNATKLLAQDADPVMRHYAVRSLNPTSIDEFTLAFVPMLHDPVKAVRIEAALKLSQLPAQVIDSAWMQPYREALAEYEKSMLYAADFPSGSFNLANLYTGIGKTEEAMQNYKKAINTDQAFFPAKINLAMLYNAQGQNQMAEQLFKEVIRDHPEQSEVYYSLGLLLAEMNRLGESAQVLEQAAAMMPERSRIYYNLGLIYQYLDNPAKAEKSLLKAVETEPSNQDFIYALFDFYQKTNQEEKAKLWSEKLSPSL
jgi:predicted CXXCH cytochrome family protein